MKGSSRGGEHVHLRASQLALVKPVLKALPERRPSCCCLEEFYTSKLGFVMMPEHRREMSEIMHRTARNSPTPQRNSEVSRIKNRFRRGCQWLFWSYFCYFQKNI